MPWIQQKQRSRLMIEEVCLALSSRAYIASHPSPYPHSKSPYYSKIGLSAECVSKVSSHPHASLVWFTLGVVHCDCKWSSCGRGYRSSHRGGYVSGKEILISVNSAQCVDRSHYQASWAIDQLLLTESQGQYGWGDFLLSSSFHSVGGWERGSVTVTDNAGSTYSLASFLLVQ